MSQNGWFQLQAGQLDAAETAYRRVIGLGNPGKDDEALYWARVGIGEVLVAQGNLPAALDSFKASLAVAERLAKADPNNAVWQYDLGISNERIGNG